MTTTCTIINAKFNTFGDVLVKFDGKVPSIRYDTATKTTSEVEVDEITLSLRAFIAQLITARPEVGDMYNRVKLAPADKRSGLLLKFMYLVTLEAEYDIESVKHSAGQQFEDGTIARYDGYTHSIVGARFADGVEARLLPISLDDALAALGY